MSKYILGIESSCDDTCAAVVEGDNNLLSSVVSSQTDVHAKFGGIMPEIASRMHVEQITLVINEALQRANITLDDISAIAVTSGPGLIGSLHVGLQAAKTLALVTGKPLISCHHLAGHIFANTFETKLNYPCLAVVVPGGHTQLVYMKKEFDFKIIGGTQDDAIGEAYDKVARIVNLGYPGGPVIDKAAKLGQPTIKFPYPHAETPLDTSFSGLKTSVINLVHTAEQKGEIINVNDLAASFQQRAVFMIIDCVEEAIKQYGDIKQIVIAGGVAANSYLREQLPLMVQRLRPEIEVLLPRLKYCADNAAMIAVLGSRLYDLKAFSNLNIGVDPNWNIEDFMKEGK